MDITMKPVVTAVRWEIPARRAVLRECSGQAIDIRPLWVIIYHAIGEEGAEWISP